MHVLIILLSILVNIIICRDFYIGMFKRNDFLVAQDSLYKEKEYYSAVVAKYGRIFKCPITYFRVVDRLGIGRGPTVEIIRGGLRKKYIVIRLRSVYNYPISVNIYVGCENKLARVQITTTTGVDVKADTVTNVDVPHETTTSITDDSKKDAPKDDIAITDNSTITNTTVDNSTIGNKTE